MTGKFLIKKESIRSSDKIYNEEHKQNFDVKDDILRVENNLMIKVG